MLYFVKSVIYLMVCIILITSPVICFGYDDERTHPHIIERAILKTRLHSFLQENLGLKSTFGGNDTLVNQKSVLILIQEGSREEDNPLCRAANHFHNPVAPGSWYDGKLTDTNPLINEYCVLVNPDYMPADISSNLSWATGYTSLNPIGKDWVSINNNEWDWDSAREYYYISMTGLDSRQIFLGLDNRSKNEHLEKTLRALGQLAHLLQDTSVPAHVRNDFSQGHLMFLEGLDKPNKWFGNSYEMYLRRNDGNPNKTFWNETPKRSQQPISRLTDLWDTDQFNSGFDGVSVDMDSFGLAEYTNLNFFSDYTRFSTDFPFPKKEHTTVIYDKPNDFSLFDRKYYATTGAHPGEQIQHLSTVSILYHHLAKYIIPGFIIPPNRLPLYFDSKCYDEYASKLIPRAVGFSADLIDYFFRGRIEISPIQPQDIVVRGNGSGDVSIFTMKASLKNITNELKDSKGEYLFSNENMEEGSLYAVAKYEIDGVVKYSLSNMINLRTENNNLISSTTPSEYHFDFSKEPIPWSADNIAIQVVFKGTLGNEQDMAVAVGRQQLFDGKMEITPPSEYVYSIIDATDFYDAANNPLPQIFTTLKASLRNELAEKQMQDGTLTAIASYRKLLNYVPDLVGTTPPSSSDREDTISFSVSDPKTITPGSIDSTNAAEFEFSFTNDPIPAGITDLYLYVVFEGTLHDVASDTDEPGSTVVGIKDLNEPQHLTFWNNTDYFLLDGEPRTAEDIRQNDPDYASYGYLDPHNFTESVAFSGTEPFTPLQELVGFSLEPGRYSRILILTDAPDMLYLSDTVFAPENPNIPVNGKFFHFGFKKMINQLNSDGLWKDSPVFTTRGVKMNDSTYFVNYWPFLYQISNFPAPSEVLPPNPAANIQFP